MTNYDRAFAVLIQHEGGYVNHPSDPGGETKYGITKRTYPHLNIKALTLDQAKEIYYRDWWTKMGLSSIRSWRAATKVLDVCVNMGVRRGVKLAQRACNALGERLVVDGQIGPKTRAAINACDVDDFMGEYSAQQRAYYDRLIARRPNMAVFRRGWYRRADWVG